MPEKANSKIILGLGNPGAEFENTYHNAGALAVRYLANSLANDADLKWKTYKKLFSYVCVNPSMSHVACRMSLIVPLAFMNESGFATKEALKKFNAVPEDLTVIHDDSDLPLGEFKISRSQSSAGHKGVQSVIDFLGTKDFQRIRIGVRPMDKAQGARRKAQIKRKKAGDFVLNKITPKDRKILERVFSVILSDSEESFLHGRKDPSAGSG